MKHFSQRVIHEHGGRLIRINPGEYQGPTPIDVGLPMGALAGVTEIARALGPAWGAVE